MTADAPPPTQWQPDLMPPDEAAPPKRGLSTGCLVALAVCLFLVVVLLCFVLLALLVAGGFGRAVIGR